MIPRILYGIVAKFNAGVINRFTPYRTLSRRKSLPEGTILWDLYTRYALEDITGVPRNVKKDCITFTIGQFIITELDFGNLIYQNFTSRKRV